MRSQDTPVGSVARSRRIAESVLASTRQQSVERVRHASHRLTDGSATVASTLGPQISGRHPSSIRPQVPKLS
jgi:hypothetical protein